MRYPVSAVARAVLTAGILAAAPVGHAEQAAQGAGPAGPAQGAGRGPVRPECVNPTLPAAECNIPPGINWPDPPLGAGPFLLETAVPQHRNIRVVVVATGLNQPWSLTWLPDGTMLVTERAGRLRAIRNGVLDPNPVAGVPEVRAQGLQGLMDVVLHPRFAENRYVYLSYHKPFPVPGATTPQGGPLVEGETVIARGTWLAFEYGCADGPITGQLPDSSGTSLPSQPTLVEPLGPAWPSCRQNFACVCRCTNATMRCQAFSCGSFQMPAQPGEMRASALTSVISVRSNPAPPLASVP